MFQMNNAGFHAEITLDNANLVFFSVPYDDGFTAYVNGEQTDIVRVDDGMMAVLCPAGTSSIDFVYQADGLALSRTVNAGRTAGMAGVHGILCVAQAQKEQSVTLPETCKKIFALPLDFTQIKCIMQSNR